MLASQSNPQLDKTAKSLFFLLRDFIDYEKNHKG